MSFYDFLGLEGMSDRIKGAQSTAQPLCISGSSEGAMDRKLAL